jgi:hypothetical protein
MAFERLKGEAVEGKKTTGFYLLRRCRTAFITHKDPDSRSIYVTTDLIIALI